VLRSRKRKDDLGRQTAIQFMVPYSSSSENDIAKEMRM
jgi:hypothetical protein